MSLRRWRIALVAWMGLIFLLSSGLLTFWMAAEATEEVFGSLNYFVRKLAHIVEYAVLTYLWLRSIWTVPERFRSRLAWSIALAVLYAVTDEVHQSFVGERSGVWTDVLFDAAGALAMGYALWRIGQRGRAGLQGRVLGPMGQAMEDERTGVTLR